MTIEYPNEQWLPVVGFEGFYAVSDHGRVMRTNDMGNSTHKGRMLKQHPNSKGYLNVKLCAHGKEKTCRVHRVVMEAFAGVMPLGMNVNHKNGVKTDNRLENLEYVTASENSKHSYRLGLQKPMQGETHPSAILTQTQVDEIRKLSAEGYTDSQISKIYNVTRANIWSIVRYKSWKS